MREYFPIYSILGVTWCNLVRPILHKTSLEISFPNNKYFLFLDSKYGTLWRVPGAGTAYPSGAPDFTSGYYSGSCCSVICVYLFHVIVLSFGFWVLFLLFDCVISLYYLIKHTHIFLHTRRSNMVLVNTVLGLFVCLTEWLNIDKRQRYTREYDPPLPNPPTEKSWFLTLNIDSIKYRILV